MFNKVFLVLCLFSASAVMAAPEIKGSPDEIEQYLMGIPKVITITERAEKVVVSNEARMSLLINTGSKKLSNALKQNFDARNSLRKQLNALGIKDSSINESKFSSTPEYGIFGDVPKAYSVSNIVTVKLASEEQMISIASIADNDFSIRYLSTKPEIVEKDKIQGELLTQAMQLVKDKAAMYQRELNVTLVPVSFSELAANMADQVNNSVRNQSKISSMVNYGKQDSFSSTKLFVNVTIQYKLIPN